jgi:hypothetical protein
MALSFRRNLWYRVFVIPQESFVSRFCHSAGIFGGFERLLRNDKHQRFLRNDKAIVSRAWFARVAFKL